jgi:hypothetical protein
MLVAHPTGFLPAMQVTDMVFGRGGSGVNRLRPGLIAKCLFPYATDVITGVVADLIKKIRSI